MGFGGRFPSTDRRLRALSLNDDDEAAIELSVPRTFALTQTAKDENLGLTIVDDDRTTKNDDRSKIAFASKPAAAVRLVDTRKSLVAIARAAGGTVQSGGRQASGEGSERRGRPPTTIDDAACTLVDERRRGENPPRQSHFFCQSGCVAARARRSLRTRAHVSHVCRLLAARAAASGLASGPTSRPNASYLRLDKLSAGARGDAD